MNNLNIPAWETFYLLTGTAAATLIGLLFVAVSINIDAFHRRTFTNIHHFAALTFNCFFYVLLISILFLIPNLSPIGLGTPLLLLGFLGLLNALIQQKRARKSQTNLQGTNIASRFNIPILCLLGQVALAIGMILGIPFSLYGWVILIIALLVSPSQNAWTLLVQTNDKDSAKKSKQTTNK